MYMSKTTTVIGIAGPSFCISTILGYIMGGLPDVQFIGETHWLRENTNSWRDRCCICKDRECHIFTPELLKRLSSAVSCSHNESNWFQIIGQAANAKTIVSSDKATDYYEELGNPDYAIVPYRDPCAWVSGWAVRKLRNLGVIGLRELYPRLSDQEIENGIATLIEQYGRVLDWIRAYKLAYLTVDMHSFINSPKWTLKQICDALNLEYDGNAIYFWKKAHHSIGGNADIVFERTPKRLEINISWKRILTVQQMEFIQHHQGLHGIYEELDKKQLVLQCNHV